jgi:hypothetical protein
MSSKNIPKNCPSCEQQLEIEKLHCCSCGTIIEGNFVLPRLARLSKDDQNFVELLVLADGSLKSVAQRLGFSYPTVRRMLDQVVEHLGSEIKSDDKHRRLPVKPERT